MRSALGDEWVEKKSIEKTPTNNIARKLKVSNLMTRVLILFSEKTKKAQISLLCGTCESSLEFAFLELHPKRFYLAPLPYFERHFVADISPPDQGAESVIHIDFLSINF